MAAAPAAGRRSRRRTADIIGRAKSGAANIRTDLTGARANIVEAARLAFVDAGQDPATDRRRRRPCSGSPAAMSAPTGSSSRRSCRSSADVGRERRADRAGRRASATGDGAIAMLGTGTVYMARRDGAVRADRRLGLPGRRPGQRRAHRPRPAGGDAARAMTASAEASPLTRAVLAVFRNEPRDVVEFTTTAKPGDFGGFAPMVFEHAAKGDAVAETILAARGRGRSRRRSACSTSGPAIRSACSAGLAPLYAPRLVRRATGRCCGRRCRTRWAARCRWRCGCSHPTEAAGNG